MNRFLEKLLLLCFVVGSLGAEESVDDFPDRPLQIVRPDLKHKGLEIVEENIKYLHRINGTIMTVSVVGKFHSGKSFLMNQLMQKSAGFGIGSKVTPETMGIWIWGNVSLLSFGSFTFVMSD